MKSIYIIGALKNAKIPLYGNQLRAAGFDVFEDWISPGPDADTYLYEYEKSRGHGYKEALKGYAAQHTFQFDKFHIDRCDIGIMIMPCGRSGHLELGYFCGQGKPAYVLFEEEPERFDLMYLLATDVFFNIEDLISELRKGEPEPIECDIPF